MRNHIPRNPNRDARSRSGVLRLLTDSQRGFTIIEVVISAVIVASIAGAAATALIATTRMSGDQRRRAQANEIAQQDQERLRGMSIKALSGFTETRTTVPYEGTTFTVYTTGRYLNSAGTGSCSSSGSAAAAYVLTRSQVNWQANMKSGAAVSDTANWATNSIRPPIVQESLITPVAGGTLLTNVVDQDNAPLSGVTVTAYGPKETQSAVTDADGCIIIGALSPTGYYVGAERSGYVDANGNDNPFGGATVSQTGTSFPTPNPFKLGEAGFITAQFRTSYTLQGSATNISGQKAPSIAWRDNQSGMSASQDVIPATVPTTTISTPDMLFPFNTGTSGVYTNNYAVWAGSCDISRPPVANISNVTVGPNGVATLDDGASPNFPRMRLAALLLNVHWRPDAATAYAARTPAHIMFTDACGQDWFADVRSGSTYPKPGGELALPGQPYAPNVAGQMLTVCVDYRVNGSSPYYRKTATTPNTNYTNGTVVPTLQIDGSVPANQGTCTP